MKLSLILLTNTLLTSLVIIHAFYLKQQFFPSVVHLIRSKVFMSIFYTEALLLLISCYKIVRYILFGELRRVEIEYFLEQLWQPVLEACFTFSILSPDNNYIFLSRLTILLFCKCFHLLIDGRNEIIGRMVRIPDKMHIRMIASLTILLAFDVHQIRMSIKELMQDGFSIEMVFAFEYAILSVSMVSSCVNYILTCLEMIRGSSWENKNTYTNYVELASSLANVWLYLCFCLALSKLTRAPLFAIRPFIKSFLRFRKAFLQAIQSRSAMIKLEGFPHPNEEQLAKDNMCIVCREEIINIHVAKKLECNHIFHSSCLRRWFQRQQSCPTCRHSILRSQYQAIQVNN